MIQKNDFIEIDFTGRVKDGDIFDSTRKEDLEKLHTGHNHPVEPKTFTFCIGHKMFLEALDDFLVGKKIGQDYEIELSPEKAFGKREPSLVHKIPLKIFRDQKINPVPGVSFNFDGRVGKVLAVSGGRVMIDFNLQLAGKTVIYNINAIRKVEDLSEKIRALNEFFFKKDFKFEVKENKILIEAEDSYSKFIELFKDKFKEILGLDVGVKKISERKKEDGKKESIEEDKKAQ